MQPTHPTYDTCQDSKLVSEDVRKSAILDTSNCSTLRSPKSLLSDISGHVRKKSQTPKILRFLENRQKSTNLRKSTFLRKSWKSAIFGTLGATLRIWPETRKSCEIEVLAGFGGFGQNSGNRPKVQKIDFFEVPKKVEIFRKFSEFLTPKKIEKIRCMPWRSTIANGGTERKPEAKNRPFFDHFWG